MLMATPNCMMWTRYFVFMNISTSCEDRASQRLLCDFTIWFRQKSFLIWENQIMFGWRRCLRLCRSLAIWSFLLFFTVWDENWRFFILYEKYRNCACSSGLTRNSETPLSLVMDLIDFLESLSIIAWISPRNSWFLLLSEGSELKLPRCCTFVIPIGLIQLSFQILCTIIWHLHTMKSSYWLLTWMSSCWACRLKISTGVNRIIIFLIDNTQLTLICCTAEKTLSAWLKWIIQNENLPITPYICVCVCVCVYKYIYIWIYIKYVCVCMYVSLSLSLYIYIYIYIYIHEYAFRK